MVGEDEAYEKCLLDKGQSAWPWKCKHMHTLNLNNSTAKPVILINKPLNIIDNVASQYYLLYAKMWRSTKNKIGK
jgi:hypothetical protein